MKESAQGGAAGSQPISLSAVAGLVKEFTLTETGNHRYDATADSASKSEAQHIVDRLYNLGVRRKGRSRALAASSVYFDSSVTYWCRLVEPVLYQCTDGTGDFLSAKRTALGYGTVFF